MMDAHSYSREELFTRVSCRSRYLRPILVRLPDHREMVDQVAIQAAPKGARAGLSGHCGSAYNTRESALWQDGDDRDLTLIQRCACARMHWVLPQEVRQAPQTGTTT